MSDGRNRDFENIIGGFNLEEDEERPEKENPEATLHPARIIATSFVLGTIAALMWGALTGFGIMVAFDVLHESGATSLPQPGFMQSWLLGIAGILILAGLRNGSR